MAFHFEYLDPERFIGVDEFHFVERFLQQTKRTQIGWHYIVDLTWIYRQIKGMPPGQEILDAGGGLGPVQYLLAELGHNVTNVDLYHPPLPPAIEARYKISRQTLDSFVPTEYSKHIESLGGTTGLKDIKRAVARLLKVREIRGALQTSGHAAWRKGEGLEERGVGTIRLVQGNLANMPEIKSDSFDAVVSLSSVEHIPLDELSRAAAELRRVTKPAAVWAITTSGTDQPTTWYHEPSKGLCFGEETLSSVFHAKAEGTASAQNVLDNYRNNSYLKEHLARFYGKSGNNGMPWGKWDPKYIPIGIS